MHEYWYWSADRGGGERKSTQCYVVMIDQDTNDIISVPYRQDGEEERKRKSGEAQSVVASLGFMYLWQR